MNSITKITVAIMSLTCMAACGGDAGKDDKASFSESGKAKAIVRDFADVVVVPTYTLLVTRAKALQSAVATLKDTPTDTKLKLAQDAWVATREPWEQSEGFIFGPVDANGFDPALDSWPVNRTDLEGVLSSTDDLTNAYVGNLDTTLQGFHTAEYLLFGTTNQKKAADFSERELSYLDAVIGLMGRATEDLEESWVKGAGGKTAYAEIFKTAGDDGNRVYPSLEAAGQEIVNGMIGILDEVANGKIADPFEAGKTNLVESQFSFNSITDFVDNILSVQNAYLGKNGSGGVGVGFSVYVTEIDSRLDTRIQKELQSALDALGQIPEPFRDAITDSVAKVQIEAAQVAIRKAQKTMENDILPLVTN